MIDVSLDYLIFQLQELGLSEREIYELLDRMKGMRIYIRKGDIIRYYIKQRYLKLKNIFTKIEIINILSKELDKSAGRIRVYLKELKL